MLHLDFAPFDYAPFDKLRAAQGGAIKGWHVFYILDRSSGFGLTLKMGVTDGRQIGSMSEQIIEILSADEIRRTITRLASEIIEKNHDLSQLVLLGIYTRGVPLATQLANQIEMLEQVRVPVGALDITFYRDDLDRIKTRTPEKTKIPQSLTGKTVVLVDDVIYKGRTIRAALNAVTEYGRPEVIRLLSLVDRGHRELPIHPDFTGKMLPTASEEQVKVYLQAIDGRDAVELLKG